MTSVVYLKKYIKLKFYCYQVNTNGYATMGEDYTSYIPMDFPIPGFENLKMLAPYWQDFDLTGAPQDGSGSAVFYHVYDVITDNTGAVPLNLATAHIQELEGDSSFNCDQVAVVTWDKVTPYPYLDNSGPTVSHSACSTVLAAF